MHNLASPLDVSERIAAAFKRLSVVDAESIQVVADEGTITLRGTGAIAVEPSLAERAAWSAPGVHFVQNDLVTEAVMPNRLRTMLGLGSKLPDTCDQPPKPAHGRFRPSQITAYTAATSTIAMLASIVTRATIKFCFIILIPDSGR